MGFLWSANLNMQSGSILFYGCDSGTCVIIIYAQVVSSWNNTTCTYLFSMSSFGFHLWGIVDLHLHFFALVMDPMSDVIRKVIFLRDAPWPWKSKWWLSLSAWSLKTSMWAFLVSSSHIIVDGFHLTTLRSVQFNVNHSKDVWWLLQEWNTFKPT